MAIEETARAHGSQFAVEGRTTAATAGRQEAEAGEQPWLAANAAPCERSAEKRQKHPEAKQATSKSQPAQRKRIPVARADIVPEPDDEACSSHGNRSAPSPSDRRRARARKPRRPGRRIVRPRKPTLPQERRCAGKSTKTPAQPSPCFLCASDAASCFGGTAGKVESRAGGSPSGRNDPI